MRKLPLQNQAEGKKPARSKMPGRFLTCLRRGIDDTKINDRPIHVWRSGRERRSDRRADRAPAAFALVGACADHRRLGAVFRWLRRAGAGLYPSGAVSTLAP